MRNFKNGGSMRQLQVCVNAIGRQVRQIIATSITAKHRFFVWYPMTARRTDQIAVVAVARDDDYFFGVLHSKLHEVWSLRMGTWLGKATTPLHTDHHLRDLPLPLAARTGRHCPSRSCRHQPRRKAAARRTRCLAQSRRLQRKATQRPHSDQPLQRAAGLSRTRQH